MSIKALDKCSRKYIEHDLLRANERNNNAIYFFYKVFFQSFNKKPRLRKRNEQTKSIELNQ